MAVNADSKSTPEASDTGSNNSPKKGRGAYDTVIKWAPLVVPLFAALIVAVIFFIDWSVLTPSM